MEPVWQLDSGLLSISTWPMLWEDDGALRTAISEMLSMFMSLYFQFDVFSVSDSSTRSIDSNTLVWFVRSSGWTVFKMEKQSNVHLSIVNNVTHITRNPWPVLHMLPNRWLSENFSTPWIIHPLFLFAPFLSWRNS